MTVIQKNIQLWSRAIAILLSPVCIGTPVKAQTPIKTVTTGDDCSGSWQHFSVQLSADRGDAFLEQNGAGATHPQSNALPVHKSEKLGYLQPSRVQSITNNRQKIEGFKNEENSFSAQTNLNNGRSPSVGSFRRGV
jgi:hypothetical protein